MNDKLYSKKTLRAMVRDLEFQNETLKERLAQAQFGFALSEVTRREAEFRTEQQEKDERREEANLRILHPTIMYQFAQYMKTANPNDTIQHIKKLRELTQDANDNTCGLREARDFVWMATGNYGSFH